MKNVKVMFEKPENAFLRMILAPAMNLNGKGQF